LLLADDGWCPSDPLFRRVENKTVPRGRATATHAVSLELVEECGVHKHHFLPPPDPGFDVNVLQSFTLENTFSSV
jgi:hypothetical protein